MAALLTMVSLEEQPLVNSFNKVFLGAAGTSTGASDDQFNRVSFLSHFDGANNGVNNAFDDGSTNNHTVTANGNVTQGSFNPFGTNWSHEFLPDTGNAAIVGGTGDRDDVNNDATRISVPASASNFAWGNPFTIEFFCFLRKLSTSNAGGFSYDLDNNFMLNQANSNALVDNGGPPDSAFSIVERAGNLAISVRYDPAGDGSQALATNAASHASNTTSTGDDFAVNTWHHVAMTWDGSNYYGYVDGVRKATINSSTAPHRSDEPIRIGGLRAGNSNEYGNMDGFISNVRIVIGTNLYPNNNFTPPTSQLTAITNTKLLTCHSNRMLDGSSIGGTVTADPQDTGMNGAALQGKVSNFGPFLSSAVYNPAVNGASAYFDGTGDYLSMDGPGSLNASANWCMECFFYCNNSNPGIVRIMSVNEATDADAFTLMRIRNNKYEFYSGGGSSYAYSNQIGTANYNEWAHIALTKAGTTVRAFVNGIKLWEATHNATNVIAKLITGWGYGSEHFPGYISDARFVNGSSIYTANFTPPTAPLTAITNTSQLLNMADGQAIDSAAQNNLTLDDNTKISTGQAKFGDTSLLFDGTNDYATTIFKTTFGAGNFTVEYFFRVGAVSTNQNLFQFGDAFLPDDNGGPGLGIRSSRWRLYTGANTATHHGSAGPSNNTWYHIAIVRVNTTTKLYVDGVETLSVSDSYNYAPRKYLLLGGGFDGSYDMNGYMDEFRVSYLARYTSNNFTVPSEPFADKGQ